MVSQSFIIAVARMMGENGERVPFLLFLGQKRHLWYSPSPPIHNTTIQLDDNTLVPSRSTQIHGKTVILEHLFCVACFGVGGGSGGGVV